MHVAFSPDGLTLSSPLKYGQAELWDVRSGSHYTLGDDHYLIAAFSLDSQVIATDIDSVVQLWAIKSGALCYVLKGQGGSVRAITFLPDSRLLASGSYDNHARLWDGVTGAALHILKGHYGSVLRLAVSPNCQLVVSGSADKTVWLWNCISGAACYTLAGHSAGLRCRAFSSAGQAVVSGSSDRTLRLWEVGPGAVTDGFTAVWSDLKCETLKAGGALRWARAIALFLIQTLLGIFAPMRLSYGLPALTVLAPSCKTSQAAMLHVSFRDVVLATTC
jgi:WD40 repeat protein